MNKLLQKVAKLTLGLAMAAGVGVAVGSNKKANSVHASPETGFTAATMTAGTNGSSCTVNTYSGIKVGTSSKGGDMSVTVPSGATKLVVYAAAWKGVTGLSLNITKTSGAASATISPTSIALTADTGISNNSPFTLSGTESNFRFELTLSNITANTVFKFASSTTKRFALWSAQTQAATKTLSSITLGGTYDTEFTVGDTFNHTGMTVTANYSDSTTATVTSSATWSSPDMSTSGTKQVTVSYTESSTTKTATYNITVNPAGTTYTVTNSVSNATLSSSASVAENDPLNITIIPGSHWVLPTSLTSVTMGGNTLTAGSGYTYNSSTGAFSIASVTGNVVITGACTPEPSYSVTYVAGDHGSGSDYVVSNQYAGSYTLATFATAGFTADSGYSFKKWSVGGVEYAEGASITISGATTVTAVYEEVTTYTIVTDASTLKDGTTFVLVGYISSTYYVSNGLNSGHVLLTSKTAATTISNDVESGSTLVSTEAQVLTLEGSTGAFKIKYGDSYLKFTGTGNGNDSFDTEANASTFSASMSGSYILFTCTSSTGSGRVWRMNTSSKDMRNYATSSGVSDVYMFANIPASNELDSVTTSGQTTSFTAGNKWSYGGTLTAHYTLEADATVTPTSYKYGASGIDPTSAGTSITTSTTLTKAEHDGKYIYVIYTEDEVTKYCSYQITVNYAAVTSVVIGVHAAEIGLNETYTDYLDANKVSVTINSQYANQGYEWIVSANTVNDEYAFDESGLLSGDTEGTITLRCRSTADNNKYDELVVTVTGDPTATFTPASVEGFVGKGTSVAFTYGNMDDTSLIAVSSSSAAVSVGAISASNDNGTVAITFVSAGTATLSISYNGGSVLDTVTVTVSADSVVAVNWTASNIKVYSGAVLPVTIEDTWMVNYEMASGDADYITYSDGDYSVKLGGSTITLPHTWVAEDDGKTLCVEYGGVQTSTVSVDVTQTLQAVMAPVEGEPTTKTWNAASGDLGASMGSTAGVTDSGSLTFDDDSTMSYTRTLEYLASGKSDYVAFSSPYIQFGSSNALETLELSVANSNVVTEVQIYCWAKNGATDVTVKVGGNVFDESKAAPSAAGSLTFSGSASGNIVITMEKASKTAGCAQYIASVAITTVESSGETVNIANVAGHEAAQKAVVAFAKAFNTAIDKSSSCTNLGDDSSGAWKEATDAWSDFNTAINSLSAAEQAYAKNLIKYATAQWTEDTDDDYSYCLERAMATYEKCVSAHGQTPFMSGVRAVSENPRVNPIAIMNISSTNTVAIIVIISMVSVTAIGGYFFLRKRKEN